MCAEVGDAVAQHRRVERHVDARHVQERVLRRRPPPPVELVLERGQRAQRAGDGVLLAAQVVVDDLERLAEPLGETLDELVDLGVVHVDLVGTDDAEAVVGASVRVAGDEVVHRLPAAEHQLDDHLEGQDAAERGERVVLADGVAGHRGALVEDVLLAQLGDLGHRERRHGHLGELRQVQHTERMAVHFGIAVG